MKDEEIIRIINKVRNPFDKDEQEAEFIAFEMGVKAIGKKLMQEMNSEHGFDKKPKRLR